MFFMLFVRFVGVCLTLLGAGCFSPFIVAGFDRAFYGHRAYEIVSNISPVLSSFGAFFLISGATLAAPEFVWATVPGGIVMFLGFFAGVTFLSHGPYKSSPLVTGAFAAMALGVGLNAYRLL